MAALAVRPTTAEAPFASGGHWAAPTLEPTALQRHRDRPKSRTAAHSNLLRRHRARTREPPKPPSAFKKAYDEGLLPLRLCYDRLQNGRSVNGRSIGWTVPDVLSLDYDHYALLFCEGLTETQEPLGFLAAEGLSELLQEGGPAHRLAWNPHAGDNGSFGREELDVIGPAVELAKERGFNAEGPFSPDTMFLSAKKASFDAIVTMYHDQGQIAMKLMDFEHGVTVLGGLPEAGLRARQAVRPRRQPPPSAV